MTDESDLGPAISAVDHIHRKPRSRWPLIITICIVVIVGGFIVTQQVWRHYHPEPWDIKYPGTEWITHAEAVTDTGKPCFVGDIQFDVDVLSAADFEDFFKEFFAKTVTKKGLYDYVEIWGFNKKGVKVMRGTAAKDRRYSFEPTKEYSDQ